MATAVPNVTAVRNALQGGRLSVADPQTGSHRRMYVRCFHGHDASVYRIEKRGEVITELIMRCPLCGEQFVAQPERILLR